MGSSAVLDNATTDTSKKTKSSIFHRHKKDNGNNPAPSGDNPTPHKHKKLSFFRKLKKDVKDNAGLYLLSLPGVVFILIFCYIPMAGILIAFQYCDAATGLAGAEWVGFENFRNFFEYYYFKDILLNTLKFSFASLVFGFPLPIIIALILNSVHSKFKDIFRVTSYVPNFLSTVVVVAMMFQMLDQNNGIINNVIAFFGGTRIDFMTESQYFLLIYVISGLWQSAGWGTIIYTSALSSVDPQLYEAAKMDGANKFQILKYVDFPEIVPTVVVTLILAIGGLMSVGFEKTYLMQTEATILGSEVISTHVYRNGFLSGDYGYGTAVGLFNSVINFMLFVMVNFVARKTSGYSIW